jgi:ribosomal protein S27E
MRFLAAQKTVSQQPFLEITCSDCGHQTIFGQDDLEYFGIAPSTTIATLGNKLFCSRCRLQGGRGYNVDIIPRHSYPNLSWRRRAG